MKAIFSIICATCVLVMSPSSNAAGKAQGKEVLDAKACPCGRADYCKGPKGGRYCVSKKGDKRYFKSQKNKHRV